MNILLRDINGEYPTIRKSANATLKFIVQNADGSLMDLTNIVEIYFSIAAYQTATVRDLLVTMDDGLSHNNEGGTITLNISPEQSSLLTSGQRWAEIWTVDGDGNVLVRGAGPCNIVDSLIAITEEEVPAVVSRLDIIEDDITTIESDITSIEGNITAINNDLSTINTALATKAPTNSPVFTGTPTAPTPSLGDNTTKIATMEAIQAAVTALVNSAPATLDTLNELAAALGDDANFAATIAGQLAGKASIASLLSGGVTVAAVGVVTAADEFFTGSIPASVSSKLSGYPLTYDDFNDGSRTTNDILSLMLNAVSGGKVLLLGPRTYTLTGVLPKALTNCAIIGIPGVTKITTSTQSNLIRLLACSNVYIYGITFESTRVAAGEDTAGGLVYMNAGGLGAGTDLTNVTFDRCKFTAPSCNTNGLKLVVGSNGLLIGEQSNVSNITLADCDFNSIGRMGFEVVNNFTGTTFVYERVKVIRGNFKDCGSQGSYGMGVSLSGAGIYCEVEGAIFDNCLTLGLENAGCRHSSFRNNRFRNQPSASASIGMSNSGSDMVNLVVTGNIDEEAAPAQSYFTRVADSYFSGNVWRGSGSTQPVVLFRDFDNNRIIADRYFATGLHCIYVDGSATASVDNEWIGCDFDLSGSSLSGDVAYFTGSTTKRNRIYKGSMRRGSASKYLTQASSAVDNLMEGVAIGVNTGAMTRTRDAFVALTITGNTTMIERDAQARSIRLDGTPAADFTLTVIAGHRLMLIWNNTGHIATVSTGSGTTVALASGERALIAVYSDTVYTGCIKFLSV